LPQICRANSSPQPLPSWGTASRPNPISWCLASRGKPQLCTRTIELAARSLGKIVLLLHPLSFPIFYRVSKTTIEVVRVLQHAQDVPPLIDEI